MAEPIRALYRSGGVLLAVAGAATIFMVLGVAGVALRAQCDGNANLESCPPETIAATPDPIATAPDPITTASVQPRAAFGEPAVTVKPSKRSVLTVDGLIAATFDKLMIEPDASIGAGAAEDERAFAEANPPQATPALPAPAPLVIEQVPIVPEVRPEVVYVADRAVSGPRIVATTLAYADTAAPAREATEAAAAAEAISETRVASVEPTAIEEPAVIAEPEVVPDVPAVREGFVRVGRSAVNVRSGPGRSQKRVYTLAAGAEVEAKALLKGWVQIVNDDGREGWVHEDGLDHPNLSKLGPPEVLPEIQTASIEEPAAALEPSGDIRTVAGSGVNVRSGPAKSAGKLFALAGGRQVTVSENRKGWLHITDDQGRTGWVYKDFLI